MTLIYMVHVHPMMCLHVSKFLFAHRDKTKTNSKMHEYSIQAGNTTNYVENAMRKKSLANDGEKLRINEEYYKMK